MRKPCVISLASLLFMLASINGADLKQAKFTQVINEVKVSKTAEQTARQAQVNELFATPEILRTGQAARAELVSSDQTITRVGGNTVFSFEAGQRTVNLERGSLLFHSPRGKGGGTIRTRSATAAVLGTTLMVSSTANGGFKALMLEGRGEVRLNNGRRQMLQAGQMTFIMPGSDRLAPVINFRLDTLVKGSQLVQGFQQPLPSLDRIQNAVSRQNALIQKGQAVDTGFLVGDAQTATGVQIIDANLLQARIEQSRQEQIQEQRNLPNRPELPFEPPTTGPGSEVDVAITTPNLDPAWFTIFGRFYFANNIQLNSSTVDLSPYNQADESFQMYAVQNIAVGTDTTFSGLTDPNQDLFLYAGQDFTLSPGTGITYAGSGNLTVISVNTMSLNNNSFIVAGREVDLWSFQGNLTFQGGSIQADVAALRSFQDLSLSGVSFTGASTINMDASTINLSSVDFPTGSQVNLSSRLGQLAPQPNTGQPSLPGYVNFINAVNYGGQPAQDFINNGISIQQNFFGGIP